jgi:hypothetical protein
LVPSSKQAAPVCGVPVLSRSRRTYLSCADQPHPFNQLVSDRRSPRHSAQDKPEGPLTA